MCCSHGWIDGDFGAGTESAVRKFRGKYSLAVDGVVNWMKKAAAVVSLILGVIILLIMIVMFMSVILQG